MPKYCITYIKNISHLHRKYLYISFISVRDVSVIQNMNIFWVPIYIYRYTLRNHPNILQNTLFFCKLLNPFVKTTYFVLSSHLRFFYCYCYTRLFYNSLVLFYFINNLIFFTINKALNLLKTNHKSS